MGDSVPNAPRCTHSFPPMAHCKEDTAEGGFQSMKMDTSESSSECLAKGVTDADELHKDEDEDGGYEIDEYSSAHLEKSMTDDEKAARQEQALQLKAEGNSMFKEGLYLEAMDKYTNALRICPWNLAKERSILYSNRAATRSRLDEKEAAIKDCTKAIDLNPTYMKPVLKRAQLYQDTEKLDEALTDFQRVLELDPSVLEARQASVILAEKIQERNEKLKTEMIGKLKELGNMVLRPFGMSTDNFKLVKNDDSGGYSVQFQK